jgi:hypothetical protein
MFDKQTLERRRKAVLREIKKCGITLSKEELNVI